MHTQAPAEDIHAIVGRFQAWAGTQTANNRQDEVRELTYEEAIGVRRQRSASSKAAVQPISSEVEPAAPIKSKAPVKTEKKPAQRRKQQTKVKRPSQRLASQPVALDKKQAFRQALSESMTALPVVATHQIAIAHRPASLSIRVSTQEQAWIKARAAEANLSASAYLRQCALEVEYLRAQLQDALAMRPQLPLPSEPAVASASGLLVRLTRRFFPRKTPSLALRA